MNVLNICLLSSSFLLCARYRGQCFGALDSGNNQDTWVCPGDLAHHRLLPEQASHHHRPHQAGQCGGQVRRMHSAGGRRGERPPRVCLARPASRFPAPPGQERSAACWRPHPVHRRRQHGTLLAARGHQAPGQCVRKSAAGDPAFAPQSTAPEAFRGRWVPLGDLRAHLMY